MDQVLDQLASCGMVEVPSENCVKHREERYQEWVDYFVGKVYSKISKMKIFVKKIKWESINCTDEALNRLTMNEKKIMT